MKACIEVASIDSLTLRLFDRAEEGNIPWLMAASQRLKLVFGEWLLDIVPSYTTLMLHYDLRKIGAREARALIAAVLDDLRPVEEAAGREVVLPVWYDPRVGPELERLSQRLELSRKRIIELHSEREYRVFTLGFVPGFAFMGLLDEALSSPRLETPRQRVPGASVAIAERQTSVYPQPSPGGWNVLGRTPARLFDSSLQDHSLLRPGDRVRFVPIERSEFIRLGGDDSPFEELA
ncbi:Kinase A inhibitor [compost metagenome]